MVSGRGVGVSRSREGASDRGGWSGDCPLCRLARDREIFTRLIYEDELVIVVDCLVCRVPMAVLKTHRREYTEGERRAVRGMFRELVGRGVPLLTADARSWLHWHNLPLPEGTEAIRWVIDWEQRRIPEHAHCHLRPLPFPGTTHWESLALGEG